MASNEKKVPLMVRAAAEDISAVDAHAKLYRSLSTNEIAALLLGELAKVKPTPGALWHALARISEDDESDSPHEPKRVRNTRTANRAA